MNENVVSIPQAREDIYHQRLNLIRNCYGDLFDAEFVARASLTSATAPEPDLSDLEQTALAIMWCGFAHNAERLLREFLQRQKELWEKS